MRQKHMRRSFQDNTLSVKTSLEAKGYQNNVDPVSHD